MTQKIKLLSSDCFQARNIILAKERQIVCTDLVFPYGSVTPANVRLGQDKKKHAVNVTPIRVAMTQNLMIPAQWRLRRFTK